MKFGTAIFVGSLLLLVIATANAGESFRCGSHIIEVGDSRESVLNYCGQPTTEKGWTWTSDRDTSSGEDALAFRHRQG